LLEKDRSRRIGAIGFDTFTDNPFFRPIDFFALERKEIEPIFIPSSDKTNFDATYDLEELLLEEAPLEARARRQKPREALKEDATEQEIRADELHRMIETLFEPFNYTTVGDQRTPAAVAVIDPQDSGAGSRTSNHSQPDHTPTSAPSQVDSCGRIYNNSRSQEPDLHPTRSATTARSTQSPNGSPPLPTSVLQQTANNSSPTSQRGEHADFFPHDGSEVPTPSFSRPMNNRQRGSQRSTSMGGGVQVVLNETGSWTEMANQSSALVQNAQTEKPSGMLGFLSRKKGRDRSPKAKERGVLGKEGARVIISNT
jgi:serine/threonine kinase 32